MVVQLTYDERSAVAYPGMLSEPFSDPLQIESTFAETAAVIAGAAVEPGTNPTNQSITLATLANWSGVAFASQTVEQQADGSLQYAPGQGVSVVSKGRMWVLAGAAVAVGDEVIPGLGANAVKFSPGSATGTTHAVARSAAASDGDLLEIEISQQV